MLPAFVQWSRQIKAAPRVVRMNDGTVIEKSAPIATGLFAYESRVRSADTLAQRLYRACGELKLMSWERPDFICVNGVMTYFIVDAYEDSESFYLQPDFVSKKSATGGKLIGYRQSFATLLASMASHVTPDNEIVLHLPRYLVERSENGRTKRRATADVKHQ
jgi:hypothetical protein